MDATLQPMGLFNLASAALMVALALALLGLDPGNRVSRAFAWFLVARGGLNVLDGVSFGELSARVTPHYSILTLFLGLFFAHEYRRRYARRHGGAATPWVLLGLGLAAEAALLLGPHWWIDPATGRAGPLILLDGLRILSYAGISLVLLSDAERAERGAPRAALELAAIGFVFFPALIAGLVVATWTRWLGTAVFVGRIAPGDPGRIALGLALLLVVPLVAMVAHRLARRHGYRGAALAVVGAAVLGTSAATGVQGLDLLLDGATTLTLPLLVGYALLRHRLFDLDVKIKWTISRGAVAGIFLAVFFVVTQVAEVYLQQYGTLLGGVAAGLMLFAISPLQRIGERIATAAMPHAKRTGEMDLSEREHAYRDMAAFAWADGALTGSERDRLDAARERLGIPLERAMEIEKDARGDGAPA